MFKEKYFCFYNILFFKNIFPKTFINKENWIKYIYANSILNKKKSKKIFIKSILTLC